MKITKRQLRQIIQEAGVKNSLVSIPEELAAAGLTAVESDWVETTFTANGDLYDNEVIFDKLFNYYMDIEEMPYEVAKARTATPDEWMYERWEDLDSVGMGF
jgi:hypothetical protein|tara:strand:+ start:1918 stop:2223 length:306 start_codon:yes stop_codon:yes gene_type:complete